MLNIKYKAAIIVPDRMPHFVASSNLENAEVKGEKWAFGEANRAEFEQHSQKLSKKMAKNGRFWAITCGFAPPMETFPVYPCWERYYKRPSLFVFVVKEVL